MSHNVETMAFVGEVPWHGLGVNIAKAPNVAKMLKTAKLDWTVSKQPMMAGKFDSEGKPNFLTGVAVPGAYALMRDSDQHILDVVGNHYTPIQNSEAFEFFKDYVEAGDATMETAGSLRGGKYVWGLAALGESFKLKGNDKVNGYLLVGAPHQQGKSFIIKLTHVRVVCNNTLTMALREGGSEFRMAHRRKFDSSMVKKAKETLGIAREQFAEFQETAEKLQKKRMSNQDAIDLLKPIFAMNIKEEITLDNMPPKLTKVMQSYEHAPGAQPGNAWGLLNGVTHYIDHVASKTSDKRMQSSWFGKGGAQKERVLEALLRA